MSGDNSRWFTMDNENDLLVSSTYKKNEWMCYKCTSKNLTTYKVSENCIPSELLFPPDSLPQRYAVILQQQSKNRITKCIPYAVNDFLLFLECPVKM